MDFDTALSEAGELGLWQWGVILYSQYQNILSSKSSQITISSPTMLVQHYHHKYDHYVNRDNHSQGAFTACASSSATRDVERSLRLCWLCPKTQVSYVPKHRLVMSQNTGQLCPKTQVGNVPKHRLVMSQHTGWLCPKTQVS